MNKTAMQQMQETIGKMTKDSKNDELVTLYLLASKLLATEKEDIADAWTAGREYGCKHNDPETGEQYYNQTFGQ
jgi:hypothetical protein